MPIHIQCRGICQCQSSHKFCRIVDVCLIMQRILLRAHGLADAEETSGRQIEGQYHWLQWFGGRWNYYVSETVSENSFVFHSLFDILNLSHRLFRNYWWLMPFFTFALPTILAYYVLGETLAVAWYAGIFRYIYIVHVTWSVNSFAHYAGSKTYDKYVDVDGNDIQIRKWFDLFSGASHHPIIPMWVCCLWVKVRIITITSFRGTIKQPS